MNPTFFAKKKKKKAMICNNVFHKYLGRHILRNCYIQIPESLNSGYPNAFFNQTNFI